MHARVVTGQFEPDKMEEAIQIYRDSIMPVTKQQKGFKGAIFLTDKDTHKSISITLWETQEDLREGMTSGYYREQSGKLIDIQELSPDMEQFEVSVQVDM